MNFGEYNIKGLKTFTGMEGGGFECMLYRGKKRVARAFDDATGGGVFFDWHDRTEEKVLTKHCAEQPQVECCGHMMDVFPEVFVDELVNVALEDRRYKWLCKTHLVFRLCSDEPGEFWTTKRQPTPERIAALRAKHGDNLLEVINDRF